MSLNAAMFSSHDVKITRNCDKDMQSSCDLAGRTIIPAGKLAWLQISCRFFCKFIRSPQKLTALQGCENFWLLPCRFQTGKFVLLCYTSFAFTARRNVMYHSAVPVYFTISHTLHVFVKDATQQRNALHYSPVYAKKKRGPIYDDFSTGRYRKSGETLPNISVCFYESGAVYPLIR